MNQWLWDDLKLAGKGVVLGTPLALVIGAGLAISQYPSPPVAYAQSPTIVITETETETMSRHALTEIPSTVPPTGGRRASMAETTTEIPAVTSTTPPPTQTPEPTTTKPQVPATTQLPSSSPLTTMPSSDTPIFDQLVTEHMSADPLTSVFATPN